MAEAPDFLTTWQKICTEAWASDDYKRKLLDNPGEVLGAEGVETPKGMRFNVVENEPGVLNLILPAKIENLPSAVASLGDPAVDRYISMCF